MTNFLEFTGANGSQVYIRADKVCAVIEHVESKDQSPGCLVCFSGDDDGIQLKGKANDVRLRIELEMRICEIS